MVEKESSRVYTCHRYTLVSASEQQPSISDFFSHVTPMQTIELSNVNSVAATSNSSGQDTDSNATKAIATSSTS